MINEETTEFGNCVNCVWCINYNDKILLEKRSGKILDWSNKVEFWEPFENVIRDGYENSEELLLGFPKTSMNLAFYNPYVGKDIYVETNRVLNLGNGTPIKNQECNERRSISDDLFHTLKTLMDSGFTREEAMQILICLIKLA